MSTTDSIIQHISKIENIAREIRESGDNISETAVITKILSTLPSKYRTFRQAWLSLEENRQTLAHLTTRLIDEEANITTTEEVEHALATTSSKKPDKKFDKRKLTCYNCKRKGHFARECRSKTTNKQENTKESPGAFTSDVDARLSEDTWILDSGASAHMT